jgi:hypothetical protein
LGKPRGEVNKGSERLLVLEVSFRSGIEILGKSLWLDQKIQKVTPEFVLLARWSKQNKIKSGVKKL